MIQGVILRVVSLSASLVGLASIAAAFGAQIGRLSERWDLLSHFAVLWLLGALLTLACGVFISPSPYRMTLVTLGGAGVIFALALIVPEVLRPTARLPISHHEARIKLIQFNAWGRNADPQGTVKWLVEQRPDIIVIEENSGPIQAGLVTSGFIYTRGSLRTAIYSRASPAHKPFQIEGNWGEFPGLVRATFTLPTGGTFHVVGTHLTWPTATFQPRQRFHLAALAGRYDRRRLILAGDFNLTPWSFALQRLDKQLGLMRRDRALFSWPARAGLGGQWSIPVLPIDHVYAGADWRTVSITRGPRLGSDHYPVVAVLALADE